MKIKYLVSIIISLAVLSVPVLAEKVLMVDLIIGNNDSVSLESVMLVDGKTKQWPDGNYKIQLLDASGKSVDSQSLPIEFFISGIGEVDTIPAEVRFSSYANAKKIQVLKDSKAIFEAPVTLCNNNKVCDNYENSLSCPGDCQSGSDDKYCDRAKDGRCDPNCAKQADEDCREFLEKLSKPYIFAALGVVVIILLLAFFLRRKSKTNETRNARSTSEEIKNPAISEPLKPAQTAAKPKEPALSKESPNVDIRTVEWAKKQLAEGYTNEQVRMLLIKYGYSQETIDDIFKHV